MSYLYYYMYAYKSVVDVEGEGGKRKYVTRIGIYS